MPINLDLVRAFAWSKEPKRSSIVAYKRHNDSSSSQLVLDSLEIGRVGKEGPRSSESILVLGLYQDDWPTICDLSFSNDGANVADVTVYLVSHRS